MTCLQSNHFISTLSDFLYYTILQKDISCIYNPLYHFREIFPVLPCIIQSTLPFQGEIFPVLPCIIQSTLPFQGDISCIALYYTIHSIISGRYFLYCPVLYNPLYHFRDISCIALYYTIHSTISGRDISCIALYYTIHSTISGRYFLYCPVLYNPLYYFRKIFPVLPCTIQSTLSFQRDISCIALYYTIHSIISGRYLLITLYYTIHSIIS